MKSIIILEGAAYNQFPDLNADDVGIKPEFVVRNNDDSLVDLTTGTVLLKMKQINTTTNKVSGTCTLDDPVLGECSYTTVAGDLDTAGVYDAELQVTIGSAINTIPLGRFKIDQDLP